MSLWNTLGSAEGNEKSGERQYSADDDCGAGEESLLLGMETSETDIQINSTDHYAY